MARREGNTTQEQKKKHIELYQEENVFFSFFVSFFFRVTLNTDTINIWCIARGKHRKVSSKTETIYAGSVMAE